MRKRKRHSIANTCSDLPSEPAQTPREYAMAAAGQLSETPELRAAAQLPRRIVDAFYHVRFGGHQLDRHRGQEVKQALHALETALKTRRANRKKKTGRH